MLDAAHGEGVGAIVVVQRVHGARIEVQVARVAIVCAVGRRRQIVAVRADIRQGSRRNVAVARSRQSGAIAGMDIPEERPPRGRRSNSGTNWDEQLTAAPVRNIGMPETRPEMPSADC